MSVEYQTEALKTTGCRTEIIGNCLLVNGDALDVLPTLGPVDAVVTDPPYGIGESHLKIQSRQRREGGNSKALADQRDYGPFEWDSEPADPAAIEAIREVSKHQIIFGGNYFALPPSSCWLVWDKLNGENDFADCELAWTNLQKAVRRIAYRWNGMIRAEKEARVHPTQKPIGVMEWCLGHLPDSARVICDPFMGSATTGVACVKRGLRFIGIEREPAHFEAAVKRIRAAHSADDTPLFAGAAE